MRQLIEILPDLKDLRILELSKVNASDSSFLKLVDSLPLHVPHLSSLDLSLNPLSFFTLTSLTRYLSSSVSLRSLNLSGIRPPEQSALDLLASSTHTLRSLNLSQNLSLGYRFSSGALA